MKTPAYIKGLLVPANGKAAPTRRAWSIELQTWVGFFTATNVADETDIPSDALGAPLRLAYGKDGSVQFNDQGRPRIKVAKPLADGVKLVRENFAASLLNFTVATAKDNPAAFKAEVEAAQKAAAPIKAKELRDLEVAIALAQAQAAAEAQAEAEAQPVPQPVPVAA